MRTGANKPGLLYPAIHKFYSALRSLEQFEKGQNFFENIACIDNFFSEYRNITFVLQKSLAHSKYENVYEEKRKEHLLNDTCRWFLEKRNEILKEHPFNLEKRIIITLYSPQNSVALPKQIFTIENDIKSSTIIDSLRLFLKNVNPIEVFFSVEFAFYEKGKEKELYDDFIMGIGIMLKFIHAIRESVNEKCALCDQLLAEIDKTNFYRMPKDVLFIDDYAYYCQDDRFEKASRMMMGVGSLKESIRMPLSGYCEFLKKATNEIRNPFEDFVLMHTIIFGMQKTLMPTFMIIYKNDTFEFKSFTGSIKTTFYREINDIAKRVEGDGIKSVFYVAEMLSYRNVDISILNTAYDKRAEHKTSELLNCYMIENNGRCVSYSFDSDKVGDMKYVASILRKQPEDSENNFFLYPIISELKRLNE